jgi:hypothetical protein
MHRENESFPVLVGIADENAIADLHEAARRDTRVDRRAATKDDGSDGRLIAAKCANDTVWRHSIVRS